MSATTYIKPKMTALEARLAFRLLSIEHELVWTKLSAKTVAFTDLARGAAVFLTISGVDPKQSWVPVKAAFRSTNVRLNLPLTFG